jgi:NAD(P)-dependent dehydrogenase (short-subunit alcohol dehydrogenase family)
VGFIDMGSRLTGKSALVTGAASGIGRAIALRFAAEGARIIVADIQEKPRLAEVPTHEYITREGGDAVFIETDVSSPGDLQNGVEMVTNTYGSLDILVNSAGVYTGQEITEATEAEYDRVVDINQKGTYFACKHAISAMKGQKEGGAIINISSAAGLYGSDSSSIYCTSKGAVTNLTRALAVEQASNGIRVNAINPGKTTTAMILKDHDKVEEKDDRSILERDAKPEDIANTALFLASDESAHVNGHNLVVDGGASVQPN